MFSGRCHWRWGCRYVWALNASAYSLGLVLHNLGIARYSLCDHSAQIPLTIRQISKEILFYLNGHLQGLRITGPVNRILFILDI